MKSCTEKLVPFAIKMTEFKALNDMGAGALPDSFPCALTGL